jgi:aryl-alcohol dehydrogenase-like predicted oxidoreductase
MDCTVGSDTAVRADAAGGYLLGGDLSIHRMGYGAMQLADPGVWGPPRDPDAAVAVLRRALELGVNHIDTSDYYGPHVVNELIRRALHPYDDDLAIVTKVGARRTPDKVWPAALSPAELRDAVHSNLKHLGVERLDVVNLRIVAEGGGGLSPQDSIEEPFTAGPQPPTSSASRALRRSPTWSRTSRRPRCG